MKVPKKLVQLVATELMSNPGMERGFVTWDLDFNEFVTEIHTLHRTPSEDGYLTAVIADKLKGIEYLPHFSEETP